MQKGPIEQIEEAISRVERESLEEIERIAAEIEDGRIEPSMIEASEDAAMYDRFGFGFRWHDVSIDGNITRMAPIPGGWLVHHDGAIATVWKLPGMKIPEYYPDTSGMMEVDQDAVVGLFTKLFKTMKEVHGSVMRSDD